MSVLRRVAGIATGVAMTALTAAGAVAQTVQACDWRSNPAFIVEPWENHTKAFANGAIRVAHLDTHGEPVCCSTHLMILVPHPEYGRSCYTISDPNQTGWTWMEFSQLTARYDPGRGLIVSVPVAYYTDGSSSIWRTLDATINQAQGTVTATIR